MVAVIVSACAPCPTLAPRLAAAPTRVSAAEMPRTGARLAALATASKEPVLAPVQAVSAGAKPASLPAERSAILPPTALYAFRRPLPLPWLDASFPATHFADLSAVLCRRELRAATFPIKRVKGGAGGIATAVRIHGPLHGVRFTAPVAPTPFGILDCRLALLLGTLALTLSEFGVIEVKVDNYYRPGAHLPRKRKRSQHAHGLAIDIVAFVLNDGRTLRVKDHWHAPIGAQSCGSDAVMNEPTPETILMRDVVCEIARRGLFHHLLTPGFNAAHQSHFHFDIKRGKKDRTLR